MIQIKSRLKYLVPAIKDNDFTGSEVKGYIHDANLDPFSVLSACNKS